MKIGQRICKIREKTEKNNRIKALCMNNNIDNLRKLWVNESALLRIKIANHLILPTDRNKEFYRVVSLLKPDNKMFSFSFLQLKFKYSIKKIKKNVFDSSWEKDNVVKSSFMFIQFGCERVVRGFREFLKPLAHGMSKQFTSCVIFIPSQLYYITD